jgi:hypothetical protein
VAQPGSGEAAEARLKRSPEEIKAAREAMMAKRRAREQGEGTTPAKKDDGD